MRLLVSVRSAGEAAAALAGGAGIIDAKEPEAGALGAVTPQVLAEIRRAVPERVPLSAALGDLAAPEDIDRALGSIEVPLAFVKLGFRAVDDPVTAGALLAYAVRRAGLLRGRPGVVAVAYADWRRAGGPSPQSLPSIVREAGGHGLLVDTALKSERTLRDLIPADELIALGHALRRSGLSYALAGRLELRDVPLARAAGADILGVRGAVCVGGRAGRMEADLVQRFAEEVAGRASGLVG